MRSEPDLSARPLIIGGMHRSGTSLTASLFASAGLDLGPELLGANASNPSGHFEDCGFMRFHARALAAQGLCTEGYTSDARGRVPATLAGEACDLLAARQRPGVAWGWKEPRTTLFLDFWQERLPEARHVFVFRRPWEVADSLFRRGDEAFVLNPRFALDVWTHYNRLILDFVGRHPDRCAVFEIAQVIEDPQRVLTTVCSRFGVPLGDPARLCQDELFTRDDGSARAALVRALAPDTWRTYEELRRVAGVAETLPSALLREASLGDCAVLEWARASRAEAAVRRHAAHESVPVANLPAVPGEGEPAIEFQPTVEAELVVEARPAEVRDDSFRPSRLARAVRHASQALRGGFAGAARLLRPAGRPADRPTILPLPQDDAPAGRGAA